MINDIEQTLPEQYRGLFHALMTPVVWLPKAQALILSYAWFSDSYPVAALKRIFLVLPAFTLVVAFWCTMVSLYTLLFRWHRVQYIATILVCWWDLARSVWLFWGGMFKFVLVLFGTSWGMLHFIVQVVIEIIREIFELPFVLTGTMTRNLFQPGVPWLAFLMTVAWSAIEALVFTYVLTPTMSEILTDLVGTDTHRFLPPILYVMLWFMISGSFACMQVLTEALKRRDYKQLVQMLIVEFFVMFVEVMFLYRELVDSLTPWIVQQTGVQLGLVPVIAISVFCWVGIRGMVWFLFARFGTPTLLALIARQRLPEEAPAMTGAQTPSERRWDTVIAKIKREQEWFQSRAEALLEAAILPAFQVVAVAVNFGMVFFLSEPLFSLPFKSLAEVGETKALLAAMPRWKEASK